MVGLPQETHARRSSTRVLILGGGGFLGSEVARAFLRRGSPVTVLSRSSPKRGRVSYLTGADVVIGDVDDGSLLDRVIGETDHVVDALGSPTPLESARDPGASERATISRLIRLLAAMRSHPHVGLTFFSSGGTVYGNAERAPFQESSLCQPANSYGVTKLHAEQLIATHCTTNGTTGRILRIANAYGETQVAGRGQGLVAAVLAAAASGATVPIYGDAGAIRDYIYAGDVAEAVVRLAWVFDGPMVVNVGTGIGYSIRDVIRIIEQATGRTIMTDQRPSRGFDAQCSILDTTRLASLVDWQPRSLEAGVATILSGSASYVSG